MMEPKDIVALLFIVLLFLALWLLMRSDTVVGRWMRSQARGERRVRRSMLSGYAIRPETPAPQRDPSEGQ
jgi:hypothetical protein